MSFVSGTPKTQIYLNKIVNFSRGKIYFLTTRIIFNTLNEKYEQFLLNRSPRKAADKAEDKYLNQYLPRIIFLGR